MYQQLLSNFQKYQRTKGLRPKTVAGYKCSLGYLFNFLNQKGITDIKEVKRETLLSYQEYLYHEYKTKVGGKLSLRYQANLISVLNPFFTYLVVAEKIMYNPTDGINMPRLPKRIPRNILTEKEMKLLLSMPDLNTSEGYRDRVLLEILYSTGIRASEVKNIRLNDIDLTNRELFIQEGKGGKDRKVPITKACGRFIETYLTNHIKELLKGRTSEYLLIGVMGKALDIHKVSDIVRKYAKEAGFNKVITTHSIRHSTATHLLKKGASIRLIQELLGHASLNSTQLYTRVNMGDLKSALDKFHPRGGI